jgi:hypothetical protein
LAILLATLLVTPAFGFWHPPEIPPPPCPAFAVIINDVLTSSKVRYNFTEPFDNFCDDVTVEVWVFNVTDLYAYEFELYWDATYFSLKEWKVEKIFADQFVVLPVPEAGGPWTKPQPYKQVVSAVNPATGVSGDFKVATLVFHIVNDVCWCQGPVEGKFDLTKTKMSDSCSQPIDQCGPYDGYWTFWPVQPKVYLKPEEEINWIVGDKFTVEVWVENITKMKDIFLDIRWDWRLHSRYLKNGTWDGAWIQMLNTSKADITINNEVFPKAKRTTDELKVNIGNWDGSKVYDQIILKIVMDCKFPLINGTKFKVMDIVFTKLDPWYCGRQPEYTPTRTKLHSWCTY